MVDKREVEKKKIIDDAIKNVVSLVLVDAITYQSVIIEVLNELISRMKMKVIYVALNKPHKTLIKFFDKNNIETRNKIFFLDTFSTTKEEKDTEAISPEDLSNMTIEIIKKLEQDYDFVIFDTIDTFLIYNKREDVEKFFTRLTGSIRDMEKRCVLIGIKESLVEHVFHVSVERISDEVVDLTPTSVERFRQTFLRL